MILHRSAVLGSLCMLHNTKNWRRPYTAMKLLRPNLHLKKWKDLILILTYIPVNSNTCLNDIIWHNLKITNFYNVLYFFFFLCVVPFKYRYFILIYMYQCILHISAMSASEYISVYRMNNQGRLFFTNCNYSNEVKVRNTSACKNTNILKDLKCQVLINYTAIQKFSTNWWCEQEIQESWEI